ncbi:methyltransferase family protein [Fluviicoccus keumensis]|uniref:Methyltransferase family protein n=1 Tax=Fluviicoccus keumensis TaxID=1435465 RepID=A0A4V2G697_9GAMM|nr:class I SAM-dependent methyltransferase [Fluviicoccus keumensis]RZU47866.1 methyltransferase family protein [Fluviicoccus keumensis]
MPAPTPGNLYTDLSAYYDGFCHEVDYAGQADFLQRAFDCLGASGGRDYLDLACGTGQLLEVMQRKGFSVAGLDNSPQMLAATAQRCPQAALILSDLAAFEIDSRLDLISCLLYSVHYSHPVAALAETLRRAYRALKPGGLFIFDMVDKDGIQNRDAVTRLTRDGADFTFRSGWRHDGDSETLELQVAIRREDADGVRNWEDRHRMTAISRSGLDTLMRESGFTTTLLERDFTRLREWDGRSFNVLVVGQKPWDDHAATPDSVR